jgi:translation initiation factor 1 (eIF-1/SUI1)
MKTLNKKKWSDWEKHHPRLYRIWTDMCRRCLKASRHEYKNYGGLGISVCQDWIDSFKAFSEWALKNGYSDELTIDRINPYGNYEPSNCRWITIQDQQRNRKNHVIIIVEGIAKKAWEWEEITGISAEVIRQRIASGWNPKRAVSEKIHIEFSHPKEKREENVIEPLF